MRDWPRLVVIAVCVWVASILQLALAPHIALFGVRPDFILIVLATWSLTFSRSGGAGMGFLCGFAEGALAGSNLMHYIVSRTTAGFLLSWSKSLGYEISLAIVAAASAAATLMARILWMFLAAPHGLGAYIGDTIGSALYNGVLAVPVYVLLRKLLKPKARTGL